MLQSAQRLAPGIYRWCKKSFDISSYLCLPLLQLADIDIGTRAEAGTSTGQINLGIKSQSLDLSQSAWSPTQALGDSIFKHSV